MTPIMRDKLGRANSATGLKPPRYLNTLCTLDDTLDMGPATPKDKAQVRREGARPQKLEVLNEMQSLSKPLGRPALSDSR